MKFMKIILFQKTLYVKTVNVKLSIQVFKLSNFSLAVKAKLEKHWHLSEGALTPYKRRYFLLQGPLTWGWGSSVSSGLREAVKKRTVLFWTNDVYVGGFFIYHCFQGWYFGWFLGLFSNQVSRIELILVPVVLYLSPDRV